MDTLEKRDAIFYQNLALLYYAMGMTDKRFVVEEKKVIIGIIKKYWSLRDLDLDVENIVYSKLKTLVDSEMSSKAAFKQFQQYYESHTSLYPIVIRRQLIEDVYAIASAYANRNKSELVLFSQIMHLFFPSK
ncbi:MAG: hypothetical protein GQ574_24860 [Crocinitomix sp.]|nr:hypothetical protein [Crocinitomix sp.]